MIKWYQTLDDKSVCSVCSPRVKLNVDLRFIDMRRLYSIKFKKAQTHRESKKRTQKEFMKETFNLYIVIHILILVHSLKKGDN